MAKQIKVPVVNKSTDEANDLFKKLSIKQDLENQLNVNKKIQAQKANGMRDSEGNLKIDKTQWNPELVNYAKNFKTSAGNSYFTGGLREDQNKTIDPTTGKTQLGYGSNIIPRKDTNGNIVPGLYESRDVQPYGKNDVATPRMVGSKIQYVEHADPKTGLKSLYSIPMQTGKPNVAPVSNYATPIPTLIQNANQTDKQAYDKYMQENPNLNFNQNAPQKNYNKGGIVGKLRGYKDGTGTGGTGTPDFSKGPPDNNSSNNGLNMATGIIGQSGQGVSQIVDMTTQDPYGRYNTSSPVGNYAAGIGGGLAKGAALGAAGGLPGIIIGGALGAITGGIKAGMSNKSIRTENNAIDLAKRANLGRMAQNNWQESQNQALQDRGFKRGGLIKKLANGGQVNAYDAPDGQFGNAEYTPAVIPKLQYGNGTGKIFGGTSSFADGGVIEGAGTGTSDSIKAKVKPSSFVVPAINSKDAEVLRKYLLPSSKKKANLNQANGEPVKLSDGEHLFTPEEKYELERQGVNMKKLAPNADDKDGYKDGGEIKKRLREASSKYQEALHSRQTNPLWTDNDVKKYKDALDAVANEYKASLKPATKAPSTAQSTNVETPIENNTSNSATPAKGSKLKILSENEYRALKPTERNAYRSAYMDSKKNGNLTRSTPSVLGNRNSISRGMSADLLNPITSNIPASKEPELMGNGRYQDPLTVAQAKSGRKGITNKQLFDTGSGIVSNLSNYILPFKQTQMGLDFLGKAGARPVGQIDPSFQNSVNKANSAAQYGFTPEEEAYVNQQNLSGLRAGQNAARNYSGGSAGNAYNMERDAANQYFGRGLQSKIASRNLQMDKIQQANELNLTKANMSRQLFNDNLNAWNQNQQAGSALVNAGLSNAIGAKMYNDELAMEKERSGISNSWLNNI